MIFVIFNFCYKTDFKLLKTTSKSYSIYLHYITLTFLHLSSFNAAYYYPPHPPAEPPVKRDWKLEHRIAHQVLGVGVNFAFAYITPQQCYSVVINATQVKRIRPKIINN